MKRLIILCIGVVVSCPAISQGSFQSTLQTGISLPTNVNAVNSTHAGEGIHFGNHLDYSAGSGHIKFGLGVYIGYLNTVSTNVEYKKIGQSIADKYRLPQSQINFNASDFKSTHLLLGPVASFQSSRWNINLWAKGGYGLNEPGKYSVVYKEGNLLNNLYVNEAGENKNGVAYNFGSGIQYFISGTVGLQLGANYFGTQTGQVNYNYDRQKGTSPLYYTAKNNFIQASLGINLKFGNESNTKQSVAIVRSRSNIQNNRSVALNNNNDEHIVSKITKSRSNIQNNRLIDGGDSYDMQENTNKDILVFLPEKMEIRNERQTPKSDFGERSVNQLQSVNNYLTGFIYETSNGTAISQCGIDNIDGEPIPGIDVKFKRIGSAGNDMVSLSTKANKDGSFSFNNIEAGNYTAEIGNDKINIVVKAADENNYKVLEINNNSCGDIKENYVLSINDKLYVEVLAAREVFNGMASGKKHVGNGKYADMPLAMGSGEKIIVSTQQHAINTKGTGATNGRMMSNDPASEPAAGKRMHKPFKVAETMFDINTGNIITYDGKLYAEVISSREAGSGLATGKTLITGDIDGDGYTDNYEINSPRDIATGQASGKRMHKPFIITKELDANEYEITSP
ncbi:MAG: hypothetical protein ABJA90_07420, partial [Ginsengibacter sp.]